MTEITTFFFSPVSENRMSTFIQLNVSLKKNRFSCIACLKCHILNRLFDVINKAYVFNHTCVPLGPTIF